MNFLLYRRNQQYLRWLSVFCLAGMLLMLFLSWLELLHSRDLLLLREKQIVSALLQEGMTPGRIASVCSGTEITEAGNAFLRQMGHVEQMPFLYIRLLKSSAAAFILPKAVAGISLCAAFFLSAVWYLKKQDHLYQEAADLVECYADGDFSRHLPMRDQTGTICRLFASIDQLSRALKVQYESERKSGEFLKDTISDISHQLKTPLAALNLYTEIIAGEPEHPDTVRIFSGKSMQSLLRIEYLIQSLLKIVRLDAGNILFEKEEILIQELVCRATECLKTRAEQEGKQIRTEGDPKETIWCDPAWTAEALENLVKNALDHTNEGSVIRIFWESSPFVVRLSVADHGCGILPEEIHHIFKRFYRSSRSSDRQGTGLGLPLSKGIVEKQGGILSVASEAGEGSVFSMVLPNK